MNPRCIKTSEPVKPLYKHQGTTRKGDTCKECRKGRMISHSGAAITRKY